MPLTIKLIGHRAAAEQRGQATCFTPVFEVPPTITGEQINLEVAVPSGFSSH
jgi:hypothetical protein